MADQRCAHCGQAVFLTGPYRDQWRHVWSRAAVCVMEGTFLTHHDQYGQRTRARPAV